MKTTIKPGDIYVDELEHGARFYYVMSVSKSSLTVSLKRMDTKNVGGVLIAGKIKTARKFEEFKGYVKMNNIVNGTDSGVKVSLTKWNRTPIEYEPKRY